MRTILESFTAGYSCLAAWADLLDQINVYPVADSDTGTNLRISLAPMREIAKDPQKIRDQLARSATGNSGNIAAAFFRDFCLAQDISNLPHTATLGRDMAWKAVAAPCDGTMLTVFDSLAEVLVSHQDLNTLYPLMSTAMQQAVKKSTEILPSCKEAGVVDSGALAMYIFFEGFFRHLTASQEPPASLFDLFAGKLAINDSFHQPQHNTHCVDVILKTQGETSRAKDEIGALGESVVVIDDPSQLKIHIHTTDPEQLRGQLGDMGEILQWKNEPIDTTTVEQNPSSKAKLALHILTDAAGSLPRDLARQLGISLLDSYIITNDTVKPESLYTPEQIYPLMRLGHKFTTAQASTFERHQYYQSICQQFDACLYLCVGSAFTGNFDAATSWKREYDLENLFTVIDTGAASGRLALLTFLTARYASDTVSSEEVLSFARRKMRECEEFVFIDELKYLVAGGRVSRASGFFGDLLHMKPVISPTNEGVRKVGMVRSQEGQLKFALDKLEQRFADKTAPVIMLNFSDNEKWVNDTVQHHINALLPGAELLTLPLSLTSGVHMGPGTWSMSCAPAS